MDRVIAAVGRKNLADIEERFKDSIRDKLLVMHSLDDWQIEVPIGKANIITP